MMVTQFTPTQIFDRYKLDYQYLDGGESISYRHDTLEVEYDAATGWRIEMSALPSSFDPMDIEESDIAWMIPTYTIGNTSFANPLTCQIHRGGVIVDGAGVEYAVKSFTLTEDKTQYYCICSRIPTGAC